MEKQRKIYDISPLISEKSAVWPGDTPFSRQWLTQLNSGSNIDLSTITTTVHIGAHADAPSHYGKNAATIDEVALEPYLGPCAVVTVPAVPLILPEHCGSVDDNSVKRILFRTSSFRNQENFTTDFTAFSKATIEFLAGRGVLLVGIDTPSVDPFDSKDLPAHHALLKFGIRNLEGLILDGVSDGEYELIALPLKIKAADASPVRAILRTLA